MVKKISFRLFIFLCAVNLTYALDRPNVIFIAIDDMNDWISLLDPESPIKTPNLSRLADKGMLFTKAYCPSPACNPSRVSTLTGLRPSTTGVYGNNSDWRGALPNRKTIFQKFKDSGYIVKGAGKIFHHKLNGAFHDGPSFHSFQPMISQPHPTKKLNGAPEYGSIRTDWGVFPKKEEDSIDFKTIEYCIDSINNSKRDKPLFLACGIYRPHSPFFAPQKYHSKVGAVPLPKRKINDLQDLPSGALKLNRSTKWFWKGMQNLESRIPGSYSKFIKSYAACCAFADAQVGKLLDAVERSLPKENTVIVLWSDHGFHLGEKDHIEKFMLWEKSTHVPFIFVVPGITKERSICKVPVDLTALYPTLLEVCGLPKDKSCDGMSVLPLLKGNKANWKRPALMTYKKGNHALRADRWRYIRYADGTEELYDHEKDPNEWDNLAQEPKYSAIIDSYRKWLPVNEKNQVPDLKRKK